MAVGKWTDERVVAGDGEATPVDVDQQLLRSLADYIKANGGAGAVRPGDERPIVSAVDKLWLFVTLAALLVFGTFAPDWLPFDERVRGYFEKVVTWFPMAFLFGKWVDSPRELLTLTRTRPYRIGVSGLLALLVAAVFIPVKVDADVFPTTAHVVAVNNEPQSAPFEDHFRPLSVVVSDRNDPDHRHDRTFPITMWDILLSGFHVHVDWRLIYEQAFNCPETSCITPSTVMLTLENGAIDKASQEGMKKDGFQIARPSAVRIAFTDQRHVSAHLPAGSYDVTVEAPCRTPLPGPLSVTQDQTPGSPYYVQFACP